MAFLKSKKDNEELMRVGLASSVVGGLVGSKGLKSVGAVSFTLGVVGLALNSVKMPKNRIK